MAIKYRTLILVSSLIIISSLAFLIFIYKKQSNIRLQSPISLQKETIPTPKPLDKYSFENLRNNEFKGSEITFGNIIKDAETYISKLFYYYSDSKKVSGLANIPKNVQNPPVIIMLRGYVDQKIYTTGEGTKRAGEVFARNGFLTLAPDFLGYGESDNPSENSIEERFETYTTVLNLLASIKPNNKIGIWAHSNGGQIAFSILAITGKSYPTVLWAPVTKPFPYSILYYTDDFEDHGKKLRKIVADFEKDYDIEKYTFTSYKELINAPIELHQGGSDQAVPQRWSDQFAAEMKKKDKNISYFTYPGDDHNFAKGSWNLVVQRNIAFFRHHLLSL